MSQYELGGVLANIKVGIRKANTPPRSFACDICHSVNLGTRKPGDVCHPTPWGNWARRYPLLLGFIFAMTSAEIAELASSVSIVSNSWKLSQNKVNSYLSSIESPQVKMKSKCGF